MRFLRHAMTCLFAVALAACTGQGSSATLDKNAFAQVFVTRVQAQFPNAQVAVRDAGSDDISVGMKWPDGGEFTWYPDNGYQQYRLDPGQLDAIIGHHLDSLAEVRANENDRNAPMATTQVLPVVKNQDWLDGVETVTRKNAKDETALQDSLPLHRPLLGDLMVVYAEDGDAGMRFIGRKDLAKGGASDVDALDALARHNLERRLGEVHVVGRDGRYQLELDANYDASLVLLIDRLRDRFKFDGDPVMAIAARDSLMICGNKDRAAVESMRQRAAAIARDSPYGLSSALYTLRDGKLVTY